MADPVPVPPPDAAAEPLSDPNHALVAPEVAAAAVASVRSMLRALAADRLGPVTRDGPSIEDVVRAAIRPGLKEWLDTNLSRLVEREVRAEIERVVGQAVS
jgi:cell pole-organizing protein PopZ